MPPAPESILFSCSGRPRGPLPSSALAAPPALACDLRRLAAGLAAASCCASASCCSSSSAAQPDANSTQWLAAEVAPRSSHARCQPAETNTERSSGQTVQHPPASPSVLFLDTMLGGRLPSCGQEWVPNIENFEQTASSEANRRVTWLFTLPTAR